MPNRSVAPPIRPIERISIPKALNTTLDNGIPLFYVNAGKQPVMRLEIIFQAGKLFDTYPGTSYFTGKMLTEGTHNHSAAAIASYFDQLGAHIEVISGFDRITLTVHFLSRHLSPILSMVREIISAPAFSETELENLKQRKYQQLLVDLKKNSFLATRVFTEKIFGEHPYGKSLAPETISSIDTSHLLNFYQQYIATGFDILVSGQINDNQLEEINQHLGTYPATKEKYAKEWSVNYTPSTSYQEIEGSLQSSIRIGMPFLSRDHADYPGMLVVNEILGGYFGSRLMRNIREDKGYTYGIHSSINSLLCTGFWLISTDVKKEVYQQTLQEISKEIEVLRNELVPESELETVKNYMTGGFISSLDTPFAIADKFKTIHYSGLDYSYFDYYLKTIREIDRESIRKLCRQYLQPEKLSTVVVG